MFLVFGHRRWFFIDEWDFLADRNARNLDDLLRPHNDHWMTLPILVWRALFRLFGLRTYVPYQAVLILLHLTAAFLLRTVMRRAGVGPWISTAAASLFVLFGAGGESILYAANIGFVGALVFGLAQLLLADHDGPIDRRDWLGLLAGLAGLLCSGVAVAMTIVIGLAMLIRRGWRVALFHTAPLGLVFVLWWVTTARYYYNARRGTLGDVARFVATGIGATFDAMGQLPGAGIVLGVFLVVGLALAWHGLDRVELRRRAAVPGALLVGTIVFLVISGLDRASTGLGPSIARSGRYLHLVAALSLPAVAVAADAVARRWRMLAPAVLVVLLIGIPGNLHILARERQQERLVPARMTLRLSLLQSDQWTKAADCQTIGTLVERTLDKGQSLRINGGRVRVFDLAAPGRPSDLYISHLNYRVYDPTDGHTLKVRVGPVRLRLAPDDPAKPVVVCG
ncbi:MAG: hypothetical protein ACRDY6_09900 [Acidimicrobiia bacterium]